MADDLTLKERIKIARQSSGCNNIGTALFLLGVISEERYVRNDRPAGRYLRRFFKKAPQQDAVAVAFTYVESFCEPVLGPDYLGVIVRSNGEPRVVHRYQCIRDEDDKTLDRRVLEQPLADLLERFSGSSWKATYYNPKPPRKQGLLGRLFSR